MPESKLPSTVSLDLTLRPELPADYGTFKSLAQALEVRDETSFQIATEMIQREARWCATVDGFFEKGRKLALESHRWFTRTISATKEPYVVRDILEPRMRAYRKQIEDTRRAEELRLQRESELARHAAEAEAKRIQDSADAEAARLRKEGAMSAARQTEAAAAQQAQEHISTAAMIADVGIVLPAALKPAGLGESQPWVGIVDDPMLLLKAIAEGKVPLMHEMPQRGGVTQFLPIVTINQRVVTEIAKRMGRADIGLPGCHGQREFSFRVSKSAPVDRKFVQPGQENEVEW